MTYNNSIYNYPDTITLSNTMSSGATYVTGNTSPAYGAGGSGGYVYSTGTGIGSGIDTITISDYSNIGPLWNNSLEVKGDANFEGDVKIKGKSLVESLEKIEEKLAILRPNEELESKWDELRELRKRYMELEKEIIEKEKVWDILKK